MDLSSGAESTLPTWYLAGNSRLRSEKGSWVRLSRAQFLQRTRLCSSPLNSDPTKSRTAAVSSDSRGLANSNSPASFSSTSLKQQHRNGKKTQQ